MTMKEYCQWKEDNPDWDKDWSAGIAGTTYGGKAIRWIQRGHAEDASAAS